MSASEEPLRSRLLAELEARLRGRGVAGIAVVRGVVLEICAVWIPESLPDEAVAGESHAVLVRSRIVRRLALERTDVPASVAELASLTPATSSLLSPGNEPRDVRVRYHPGWVSHGVVASTPSEVSGAGRATGSA